MYSLLLRCALSLSLRPIYGTISLPVHIGVDHVVEHKLISYGYGNCFVRAIDNYTGGSDVYWRDGSLLAILFLWPYLGLCSVFQSIAPLETKIIAMLLIL